MKNVILALILFLSIQGIQAKEFTIKTSSQVPDSVCHNMGIVVSRLSQYIDIELLSCEKLLKETKIFSSDEYSVDILVSINVKKCASANNQVIDFNIPTNTYYHWNPPMPYGYIQVLIGKLGFESPITVRNIGPSSTPTYKQMIIIPECSFK